MPVLRLKTFRDACAWLECSTPLEKKSFRAAVCPPVSVTKAASHPTLAPPAIALCILFESYLKKQATNPVRRFISRWICAATEYFKDGSYVLSGEGKTRPAPEIGLSGRALCRTIRSSLSRRHVRRMTGTAGSCCRSLGDKIQLVRRICSWTKTPNVSAQHQARLCPIPDVGQGHQTSTSVTRRLKACRPWTPCRFYQT